jgi:hypothetical protein
MLSVAISNGLPPPLVLDAYDDTFSQQNFASELPIGLQYRRKLSQIVVTGIVQLGKNVQVLETQVGASLIRSNIELYAWQISQMETQCPDNLGKYICTCKGYPVTN